MSKKEALHQLYAQCQKINFDESYDIIASASDPDEANFFRTVTDLILKQKQKKVIEANRFQMRRYILFAGCNGVGKSTLYQTNDLFRNMPRVNMDEIVREFGSWKNESDAFKAGKIAVGKLNLQRTCLERFVFATSLKYTTTQILLSASHDTNKENVC